MGLALGVSVHLIRSRVTADEQRGNCLTRKEKPETRDAKEQVRDREEEVRLSRRETA